MRMIAWTLRLLGAAAGSWVVAVAADRVLWANDHLQGSPEPPSPYTVERVFPKLPLKSPLYLSAEPGSDRLWVILQGGEVDRPSQVMRFLPGPDVTNSEPMLSLSSRLIYGLTFHPGYATNRFLYLFSNGPTGATERTNRVSRFTVSPGMTGPIPPETERIILEWRSAGHDGGDLAFGKDSMLYITAGDGTSDSDAWDSGQDISNLLATLIRIDVDHAPAGAPYVVPLDNPFIHTPNARPEIWAFGFRNPWRMSIDPGSGDIWVGNNGQDLWETAYLVRRGDNFGWSVTEGNHPFYSQRRRGPAPIVPATIEHSHADFRSLTGGVVYRGALYPELDGTYIYGDYGTGKIWGARHRDGKLTWHEELTDTTLQIAAFRNDQHGNLLIVDHGGGIYRLVRRPDQTPIPFPDRLSGTGLFTSTTNHSMHPGLIPYEINAPGWADGAVAERWLALPGAHGVQFAAERAWGFTNGTVLVQTLSTPALKLQPGRRLETRILVRQQNEWFGYSYRWNCDQTDAELVRSTGENLEVDWPDETGQLRTQKWRIPSRAECLSCHSRAVGFVLGTTTLQLNRARVGSAPGTNQNQLTFLAQLGVLHGFNAETLAQTNHLVDPYDERAELGQRARSYLHANCSVCHVEAGGGNSQIQLEFNRELAAMGLVGARPQHDALQLDNAMLVAPGAPERSVLLARVSRRGRGQMPPLVTTRVDDRAVTLLRTWIQTLPPGSSISHEWKTADLARDLPRVHTGRSFKAGAAAFKDLGCAQCHRLGTSGGSVGPDLTTLGTRAVTPGELLESILEPSRKITEGYATYDITLRDGSIVSGQIETEDDITLVLRAASGVEEPTRLLKADLRERQVQALSNMPAGMLNTLEKDTILDLLAYLLAGGENRGAAFKNDP